MDEATRVLHERSEVFDRAVKERDRRLAEDVLHPAYALVLVHPAPTRMPRARWLEVLADYVVHTWETREQVVEVHDQVGTVLTLLEMEATVLGEDRSGLFVTTDTWLRDETWQVWRRHSTPLRAGRMPGTLTATSVASGCRRRRGWSRRSCRSW